MDDGEEKAGFDSSSFNVEQNRQPPEPSDCRREGKTMSMSKKDFIALADALRPVMEQYPENPSNPVPEMILVALCGYMRRQNPNFMEQRWRDYLAGICGPSGGAIKQEVE